MDGIAEAVIQGLSLLYKGDRCQNFMMLRHSPRRTEESTRMRTIFISPMTVVVTAEVILMTKEWIRLYARAFTQPKSKRTAEQLHGGTQGLRVISL